MIFRCFFCTLRPSQVTFSPAQVAASWLQMWTTLSQRSMDRGTTAIPGIPGARPGLVLEKVWENDGHSMDEWHWMAIYHEKIINMHIMSYENIYYHTHIYTLYIYISLFMIYIYRHYRDIHSWYTNIYYSHIDIHIIAWCVYLWFFYETIMGCFGQDFMPCSSWATTIARRRPVYHGDGRCSVWRTWKPWENQGKMKVYPVYLTW